MPTNVSQLVADLTHPDQARRTEAAEQLSRLGPDARGAAVPLVRACADEAEETRGWAVAALEELGPPNSSEVDALISLLRDENPEVGYWAATLLGRLGREAAVAVPALAAAVWGTPNMAVRQRAAWALGKIGPRAETALDALKKATADDDRRLARLAQRAIEQIGC